MTEDQYDAAIDSLAAELTRLAHLRELPADDEDIETQELFNLAFLMRMIPDLCSYNIAALTHIVQVLHNNRKHDNNDGANAFCHPVGVAN